MLAVGGYGRRELFPYSDIDIMILAERETQTASTKDALSEFVRLLWDSGLRLSHSVRTIAECAEIHEQNIELSISLLDRRFLAGAAEVYAKLETKFPAFLERQSRALTRHLCQLTRARHAKYQGTFYHLEPDIKETPGGLRDVHLIAWLAKLRNADATLDNRLAQPTHFLASLRCYLHYQAQRDQNLLSFEAQHELAQQSFLPVQEPSALMRQYFQNARVIYNEARRALDLGGEKRKLAGGAVPRLALAAVERGFHRFERKSLSAVAGTTGQQPRDLFFACSNSWRAMAVPLAAETERRVEAHRETFAPYCAPTVNRCGLRYAASSRSSRSRWRCESCTTPACFRRCSRSGTLSRA